MTAIAFTAFRRRLAELFDKALDSGEPLIITRANGRAAVLLPMEEYEAMKETAHLLSTEANRQRLKDADEEAEQIIRRRRAARGAA